MFFIQLVTSPLVMKVHILIDRRQLHVYLMPDLSGSMHLKYFFVIQYLLEMSWLVRDCDKLKEYVRILLKFKISIIVQNFKSWKSYFLTWQEKYLVNWECMFWNNSVLWVISIEIKYYTVLAASVDIWFCSVLYFFRKKKEEDKRKSNEEEAKIVREVISVKYEELGPMTFHEGSVLILFIIVVILWFFRKPEFIPGWAEFVATVWVF